MLRTALFAVVFLAPCTFAQPRVSDLAVADLTAKAFRLVWNSGADSSPEIEVFLNAAGTNAAPGLTITPFSLFAGDNAAVNVAAAQGVQEIEVTGLAPDTTYHVRARSVSLTSPASAQSALFPIRTAATPLLALSGGGSTAFANPVLDFAKPPSTDVYSTLVAILSVSAPGGRSASLALPGDAESWFIDLNGLVAEATGTPLRLESGTPLEASIYLGKTGLRRFTLYAPSSDDLAEVRPPALSPQPPANANILAPAPGLLLMEFAADPGSYYAVESSPSMAPGTWGQVLGATLADTDRFFFSTSDLPDDRAFFRTRLVEVFPPAP